MDVKISVLLIAQDVETCLRRCLDSLQQFDEVVYVDGGSTDKSIEIAREYSNVVVYENPWPGFIQQRNFSLEKASHEWCFMIDADEMLPKESCEEIYRLANSNSGKVLYKILRTEFYLGKALESGYGKSDYQERLFITNRIKYTGGNHHEHLIDGKPSKESPDLIEEIDSKFRVLHDERYGLKQWVEKLPRFVLLGADEKIERGRKTNAFIVLLSFPGTFLQIFLKSLFLGRVGFIIAVQTALFRCLVKLLIYEHQHISFDKSKSEQRYLG